MTDRWSTSGRSTQPNPERGQVFVGSHGAGATAAGLGVQLENEFDLVTKSHRISISIDLGTEVPLIGIREW